MPINSQHPRVTHGTKHAPSLSAAGPQITQPRRAVSQSAVVVLGILALFGSYVSFQFLITQYLQTASGWTALGTALAFPPAGVLVVVASPRMGLLLDRFGPALMVTVALGCLVAGYALFLRIGPHPDYPGVILPSVLLIGAAFGLGFSALNVQATAGVADAEQGLASGILQTSMQIGGALVLAIVTAVVDAHGGNRVAAPNALLSAYRPALEVITGVAAVGVAIAASGLAFPGVRRAGTGSQRPAEEIERPEFETVVR
jgi:predicted MFS family arabinose efflux permease